MQNLSALDTPEILPLLFQPPRGTVDDCPACGQDVVLTVDEGISLTCRFYQGADDAPTLLYFPGGRESCASFNREADSFIRHGINIFLMSYRGYGRSTGTPSVSAMRNDGCSLFSLATDWLQAQGMSGPLFVMGRSLGSFCAIDIVHDHGEKVKGLFIESGFCETAPLLQALGVPSDAVPPEGAGFANLRKIAGIKTPTMIFHGARDCLVPVVQAEKLQAASGARNKQFLVVPGAGHDSIGATAGDLYYQKIRECINSLCGLNTWRQRRREQRGKRP